MTKGLLIEGGHLKVKNGTRTVLSTQGPLVSLLPTLQLFTGRSITFPDGIKDHIYAWRGKQNYGFNPSPDQPDSYLQSQIAQCVFTRCPQEYEFAQNLMAAPVGANTFFGWVKLSRTGAPTHQWYYKDLVPLQPQGQWIPWQGSGLMEQGLNLARLMHLVVEGGVLKLVVQQSVGPPTGGAVHTWGHWPSIFPTGNDREGGNFIVGSTPGQVVWVSTASPYRKTASRTVNSDFSPGNFTTLMRGQSGAASTTDPTNYQSTYTVDVKGYFGRIST